MQGLLRTIKGFFRTGKSAEQRFSGPPAIAPDWLPEHQAEWRTFVASPAGQVLLQRGRAIQFYNATQACKDVFHTSHSAGSAKGFGECLDWLESLSRVSRVIDKPDPDGANGPGVDTRSRGEAALREMWSP